MTSYEKIYVDDIQCYAVLYEIDEHPQSLVLGGVQNTSPQTVRDDSGQLNKLASQMMLASQ